MPITSGDILLYQSTSTASTGGVITGSTITSNVKNNVWPDIDDASRVAGGTLYRKTFWKNNNITYSALSPVVYTPILPTNMTLQIGLGISDSNDADSAQGNMTAWSAPAVVSLISSAADTRVARIYGMNNAGTPVPTTETVTLTGAVEVLSVNTYSKVWAVHFSSTNANTVTIKQGAAGTSRGTVASGKIISWLWVTAGSKAAGIALPDLASGASYGTWRKLSWSAGAGAIKPDSLTLRFEENS